MSAAHDHHAPEQPEFSHPIIWTVLILGITAFLTWLFFHNLFHGMNVARHHHKIHVHSVGEAEPDHKALMANRSSDVIDQGAAVYNAKCASCHGAQGNSNPSNLKPAPRNFHTDGWKNPQGGGPYALYQVLVKGLGTMPPFPGLSAEDKYAVNHYIAETMVKKFNKDNYVATDSEDVQKTIPAPGVAGGHGADHDPASVVVKAPVQSLMAGLAQTEEKRLQTLQQWTNAAREKAVRENASAQQQTLIDEFAQFSSANPGLAQVLHTSVMANNEKEFQSLLLKSDGSGTVRPAFQVLSTEELRGLFALLKGGK
jgi:mono/diheme cytochrome c family protein